MWKYRRAEMVRQNTTKQWAMYTDEERAFVCEKLSQGQQRRMSGITDVNERRAMTANARAAIDRKKQGAAASAGLKGFWEDLRTDPDRYAAYIEQRKVTLAETLRKKDANL